MLIHDKMKVKNEIKETVDSSLPSVNGSKMMLGNGSERAS